MIFIDIYINSYDLILLNAIYKWELKLYNFQEKKKIYISKVFSFL